MALCPCGVTVPQGLVSTFDGLTGYVYCSSACSIKRGNPNPLGNPVPTLFACEGSGKNCGRVPIKGDTYLLPHGIRWWVCEDCYYTDTGIPRPTPNGASAAKQIYAKAVAYDVHVVFKVAKKKCDCSLEKLMAEGCREHV